MYKRQALGNGEEESVRTFSLEEAAQSAFRFPNCLILQRNKVQMCIRDRIIYDGNHDTVYYRKRTETEQQNISSILLGDRYNTVS